MLFRSGDIFLPHVEVKSGSNYANGGVDTTSEAEVPLMQGIIASPAEAWDRILKNNIAVFKVDKLAF